MAKASVKDGTNEGEEEIILILVDRWDADKEQKALFP